MVSVVIPTKDEEKIFTTIERTKIQKPKEIIVVNDSKSSEDYKKKLQEIEDIEYFEVQGGTARARNKGAKEASSDKIIFLDADCYPTENWLGKMSQALEEYGIVEGEVEYIGERCPFSRIVENRGEEGRFLTANLGVRKEIFEEVKFDEKYAIFREDTDFGLRVLEKGYNSKFVEAKIEHDAGQRSLDKFVEDQLRYKTEPYFYSKFKDYDLIDQHIDRIGPVLYPKELLFEIIIVLSILGAFINPITLTGIFISGITLSSYMTIFTIKNKEGKFCLNDWLKGIYAVPVGIFAKRYAIWKGALKYEVNVV